MLSRIRKALMAGGGAFLTGLLTAAIQKGDPHVGWPEIGAAALLGIAAGFATWRIPNAGPQPPAGVTGTYGGQIGAKP